MNKKCQVFTPEDYVKELLDSVGYTHNLYGKRILENSCGDGNILVAIVQRYIDDCIEKGFSRTRIKNGLEKDIYGIEIDQEQYNKCLEKLNGVLECNNVQKVNWKIYNLDYLRWEEDVVFHYVVGNPPYITYSELKDEERMFVKGSFETCDKGKFDYCYAFIEKSIKSLTEDGKMSYLIPSSIFKTVFGQKLRTFMLPYISEIRDYTRLKVFDAALVKSAIMILDKQREEEYLHYYDMTTGVDINIDINNLEEKWFFVNGYEMGERRFGDYFKVSHVVATLLNEAYVLADGTYTEVEGGYVCNNHFIEEQMVRNTETPRTLRYDKHEKIIFPYSYGADGLLRFEESEFVRLFPGTVAYLNEFRTDLDKRKSDSSAKWFEYGRSQALSNLNCVKLLISTVVTNDVEVYELTQECIPYAGMYIVEKENNNLYTLAEAMEILKGTDFKRYVLKVGIPISGQSVRITSKDIEEYRF